MVVCTGPHPLAIYKTPVNALVPPSSRNGRFLLLHSISLSLLESRCAQIFYSGNLTFNP